MLIPNLRDRNRRPEIMDGPDIDPADHRSALRGLRRINAISGGTNALWSEIRALAALKKRQGVTLPLRVLDLATGGGDVPIGLWHRARREGVEVEFSGCDISPTAVVHARELARGSGAVVEFFEHNVIADGAPDAYDVLTCSLFLHHLDEPKAVGLLRSMWTAARDLALVDDLVRSRMGWTLANFGVRLLSRSKVVHVDAPRSVEGAFTIAETVALAKAAGWPDPAIRQHWPARFLLAGRKQ